MSLVTQRMKDHAAVLEATMELIPDIEKAGALFKEALASGHKILFCGNGGSAADSQHLAAEIVGRFQKERRPFPAIALTVDTSILTAVGNDYGFETVFARQVRALGEKGDVLVGISTSGNSQNDLGDRARAYIARDSLGSVCRSRPPATSSSGAPSPSICSIGANCVTGMPSRASVCRASNGDRRATVSPSRIAMRLRMAWRASE